MVIFDGREFAEKVTEGLSDKVRELEKKMGRKLKMVTIYNPEDKASRVYTNIKGKKGEEMGIEFQKLSVDQLSVDQLSQKVKELNSDETVDGVMIQLPLIDRDRDRDLRNLITSGKDVDGLNPQSGVQPATVRAVMAILNYSLNNTPHPPLNSSLRLASDAVRGGVGEGDILVVGNKGMIGQAIEHYLSISNLPVGKAGLKSQINILGMDKDDFQPEIIKKADIVISATGQAGLIKPEMVKPEVICIDVGYPKGDFDPSTALRASFFTPVPGGVGPVTVAMLFANLVDLVNEKE